MSRLSYIFEFLFSREMALGLFCVTFIAFLVSSVVLIFTRWGESQAIVKCMALSVLAHVALALLLTIVPAMGNLPTFAERVYQITLDDGSPDSASPIGGPLPGKGSGGTAPGATADPWEEFVHDGVSQPDAAVAARVERPAAPEPDRESLTVPRGLPIPPPLTAVVVTRRQTAGAAAFGHGRADHARHGHRRGRAHRRPARSPPRSAAVGYVDERDARRARDARRRRSRAGA